MKLTTKFRSTRVYLEDNPWRMPPEAVIEKGFNAVQTFLNDVKEAGASTISLQYLKVVLVGSSQAGKTRYRVLLF